MKTWTKFALFLIALAAVGAILLLGNLVRHGISAREKPAALEEFLARRFRALATPRAARKLENPVPATEETLVLARAHFADHCAICHGNDGRGRTTIGRNLYPKAPDMTRPATQKLSDGELFYIIKNGIRLTGMPAWGEDTPQDDLASWHLVRLIRHLPDITPQELEEMARMNPRSPEDIRREEEEARFLQGEDIPTKAPEHRH